MKVRKFFVAIVMLLSLIALKQPAFAYEFAGSYLPWKPSSLGQAYPMKCIARDALKDDFSNLPLNVRCQREDGELHFSGRTKKGKTWNIRMPIGLGLSVYKADLDANGHEDIFTVLCTGACGIAPGRVATSVLFDEELAPHIYEISGEFEDIDRGVADVRKFAARRRAVFIVQSLTYSADNSYWRTVAHECSDCRWVQLKKLNAYELPAFVHYTHKRPHRTVARVKIKAAPDDRGMKDVTAKSVDMQ